jgi:hypothetical protein
MKKKKKKEKEKRGWLARVGTSHPFDLFIYFFGAYWKHDYE